MMSGLVYLLCAVASSICGVLMLRSYLANRSRLVFWMLLGFVGLAINNGLLFIDLAVTGAEVDLSGLRSAVAVAALSCIIYGFVKETA